MLELQAKRETILERYDQFKRVGPTAELGPSTFRIASNQYELELHNIEGSIRRAELDVQDGDARDELQETRPPGCFCFGLGGRGLCLKVGDDPEDCSPIWRWSDGCGCPDGLTMEFRGREAVERNEAEDRKVTQEIEERRAEERRQSRILTSGITPRVLGMTWMSHPERFAGAEQSINRLRLYSDTILGVEPPENFPVDPRRGVYLHGDVGTGKTCLTQLALLEWINSGRDGQFINLAKWLEAIRNSFERNPGSTSPRELANAALTSPLLVVDDLGTEYLTEWGAERVFLLVNERYERKLPTIYTSNYPLGELVPRMAGTSSGGRIPDMVRGQRIVDRIYETCDQLELSGASLRVGVPG